MTSSSDCGSSMAWLSARGRSIPSSAGFAQGLVAVELEESPGGPARKYYKLTTRGEVIVARMNNAWDLIEAGVKTLRKGEP